MAENNNDATEISIEETNRLRAQLGLKQLTVDSNVKKDADGRQLVLPILAPPKDAAEIQLEAEEAREAKRAREFITALQKENGDDETASDLETWAASMISEVRPVKRAKADEENDANVKENDQFEDQNQLESLRVIHKPHELDDITEDEGVILTLRDQPLLDKRGRLVEGDDLLESTDLKVQNSLRRNQGEAGEEESEETRVILGRHQSAVQMYDRWADEENETFETMKLKDFVAAPKKEGSKKENLLAGQIETTSKVQRSVYTAEEMAEIQLQKLRKQKRIKKKKEIDEEESDPRTKPTIPIPFLDEGAEDDELYAKLMQRRAAVPPNIAKSTVEAVAAAAAAVPAQEIEANGSEVVVLTETNEFCRNLETAQEKEAERPEVKIGEWRKENYEELQEEFEKELPTEKVGKIVAADEILQETQMESSMSSALAVLRQRNILETDKRWRLHRNVLDEAMPKSSADDDSVKIEHRDEFGRNMTPKEAFRVLSWHFHGKGPGKKKREKLLAQVELEQRRGVIVTQPEKLPTMRALQKSQKEGKAFVVLSNGTQ